MERLNHALNADELLSILPGDLYVRCRSLLTQLHHIVSTHFYSEIEAYEIILLEQELRQYTSPCSMRDPHS